MFPRASAAFRRTYLFASCKAPVRGSTARGSPISPKASAAFHRTNQSVSFRAVHKGVTASSVHTCPRPAEAARRTCLFSSTSALTRNDTALFSPLFPRVVAAFVRTAGSLLFSCRTSDSSINPPASLAHGASSPVRTVAQHLTVWNTITLIDRLVRT